MFILKFHILRLPLNAFIRNIATCFTKFYLTLILNIVSLLSIVFSFKSERKSLEFTEIRHDYSF
jgi:hypothetical protein